MNATPVYLDYNSTTPVDERVLELMLPYFTKKFGNASSRTHAFGWEADEAVNIARNQVAELIGCIGQEIVFTSGATESINLAIKGVFEAYKSKGNHIVTVKTEHNSVLDVCSTLEKRGAKITYLDVDSEGLINLTELENSISPQTILVCVMYANNETGVIQPIKNIAEIVHKKGSVFLSDATQALGKLPVNVDEYGIDLMPLSSHKMYGPKGAGALFIRRKNPRVTLVPLIEGGGHERGLRSGTLNVPGILGLGKACELAKNEMDVNLSISQLRDKLQEKLLNLKGVSFNGSIKYRLPNTLNVSFDGLKAENLILKIKDFAVSTGSACTSALIEPSHVLKAMGLSNEKAYSSIRFSLGKYTTEQEINKLIEKMSAVI
ncbi:MAG: IscS subfamily cysteine desulfurase [Bacteroidetes bacterium]|nr:IscS subfamily cysteine desulfurase [Bacteroidota bacterium]HET6244431.1 IscS subfamily cysteine desulfurase [Bacteroidia bacterium]